MEVWALGLIAFRALAGVSYWKRQGQWPALLIEVTSEPLATASARAADLGHTLARQELRALGK